MKASVIIPNWNGEKLLKVCLPSLEKQTFRDFEVIIVDNGSGDSSVEFIKTNYPQCEIIRLEKNYGFAPAVNLGIKAAKGEYVILLNNDTKIDRNCFKYLARVAEDHPEVGMIAAKMLNFYHPELIDSAGDYIDAVGHANNIGLGEQDGSKFNKAGPVFLVTGGGSLIKKTVFEKVGFLDEDYFAYFEDVDLCLRAQLAGFKGWYEPKAVIYHIHKATANRKRNLTEYLQFRNMTMTVIKNFPNKLLFANWNLLKIILVNINTIRYLASIGYLKEGLLAESYILRNIATLLKKRKQTQKLRQVPEEYIVKNVRPKYITLFGLLKKGF